MRAAVILAALLLLACDPDGGSGDGGTSGGTCRGASDETTSLDAQESAFLDLLNGYRSEHGRSTLVNCVALSRAAQGHSEDMRDRMFFDHTNPDGDSAWERTCAACYEHGCTVYSTELTENIAGGFGSADAVFAGWMASSGHNRNMLTSPASVVGIGRADGFWTLDIASDDEPSCR